jgi:hypothetical protein
LFVEFAVAQNKNTNGFIRAWKAIFETFIELSSASHGSLKQSKLELERVYGPFTPLLLAIYLQKVAVGVARSLSGNGVRSGLIVAQDALQFC